MRSPWSRGGSQRREDTRTACGVPGVILTYFCHERGGRLCRDRGTPGCHTCRSKGDITVHEPPGWSRRLGWFVVLLTVLLLSPGSATAAEPKQFTLITVDLDGTKIWLPSSLMVQQGDDVELTLINKLDAPHGFELKAFGVEQVVQPKSQITVKFTASQAGAYHYICQLHPPHLGGNILVLSK